VTARTRLPDFVIIGAMKSATTSLYRWLADQPEIFLARPKETDFFTRDDRWARGATWYASLFEAAGEDQLLGEASVSYSSPRSCEVAAYRMASTIPTAKLVCVLRHPLERIRSHYRHEVQRGRERRRMVEALRDPANPYVGHSRYFACLNPYLEWFGRDQLCVVRFDDLIDGEQVAWRSVISHLGLPYRTPPGGAYNVSDGKAQHTRVMALMLRSGWLRSDLIARVPSPIRRFGKRLVTRRGSGYRSLLESALAPIPPEVSRHVWEDVGRLEERLGRSDPLWETPAVLSDRGNRS
jgi:Sulfotransferase family